mmetsp:Transcript_21368/g.27622  ORF Transcript_21368/g.27622 Transcript_21368/m.27622 type:complete len:288 (+) Transcript_21368:79-942(+)
MNKFTQILFIALNGALFVGAFVHIQSSSRGDLSLEARKSIMAGNWKMNPTTIDEAFDLATGVAAASADLKDDVEVVVIPSHPFLVPVKEKIEGSKVKLGAQNCFTEDKGAYTGSVSSCMIKSIGVEYVLAGHSERRTLFRDDDSAINRKVRKILDEGMIPILCIGELKDEFEEGLVEQVCALQLAKDLRGVSAEEMKKIVIAYEPVWAIGTGLTATPEIAQNVHAFIRSWIAGKYGQEVADEVRIQYGGSVTPETVDELMSCPDIDGCLVGGASLDASKFGRIMNFN